MSTPFHQRLYLRIWLAVVAAVVVLALVVSWLARRDAEQERQQRPGREIVIRNLQGEVLGQSQVRPNRTEQGPEFEVAMKDGSSLFIQLPRPNRQGGGPGGMGMRPSPPARLPFSFAWMVVLVALAVALVTYPIVRRLTKRLEIVQRGVERWGAGDLSTRLSEQGQDEVAFLAARFNHAAERIEALLTDQKKLLDAQKALLQSQKSLLANASHELRSPLARIRMGLELMAPANVAPAPGVDLFKAEISRNIAELDQLIEEILLASRLDSREADMGTVEAVDLIGLAAEECARSNAELDVAMAPTDPATPKASAGHAELRVLGITKLLRRALRNLIENARRHAAGAITVSLRQENGQALIQVCDCGPGVPPELRERIFEPFYRLPGASEQGGGVGLGLALVKSIAERHGGAVNCRNRPEGGACFEIRLPLSPAATAQS